MIQNEGVDSLSEQELRQACRERGMLGLRSVEDMRKQVYVSQPLYMRWVDFLRLGIPFLRATCLCKFYRLSVSNMHNNTVYFYYITLLFTRHRLMLLM